MAIIECPGCGGTVSGNANVCPHCGYDLTGAIPADGANAPQPGKGLKAGDRVTLGHVPNSGEPISWTVLDARDGKALLLSDKVLDSKKYNEERDDITWEACTLRKWLNGEFLDNAFSAEEKRAIAETHVVNSDNPRYGTKGGNDTRDHVFLLSLDEVRKYWTLQGFPWQKFLLGASEKLICGGTEQAVANGLYTGAITAEDLEEMTENDGPEYPREIIGAMACQWWLRSPGIQGDHAAFISYFGYVDSVGVHAVLDEYGVRPAVWANTELIP